MLKGSKGSHNKIEYCEVPMLNLRVEQKVLIVDDCQLYTTLTREMLVKLGLQTSQIDVVNSAQDCLRACRVERYAMVMLDYNLGGSTNGRQILSQLYREKLLDREAVVVIVTADSSTSVVRSFLELNPDGYLVKPLSFEQIKSRLPTIINNKLTLLKAYQLMEAGKFEEVILETKDICNSVKEVVMQSILLHAEALITLRRFDEAKNLLITNKTLQESPRAAIVLSKVYQAQGKYKLAEELLIQFKDHPVYRALILDRLAELSFCQKNYNKALSEVEQAIEFSPQSSHRYLLKADIALSLFDLSSAISSLEKAMTYIPKGDASYLYLLQKLTSLWIDYAYCNGMETHSIVTKKVLGNFDVWRKYFAVKEYKPFEVLFMARLNAILGYTEQAEQQFKTVLNSELGDPDIIHFKLECLKLKCLLNYIQVSDKQVMELVKELAVLPYSVENRCFSLYFAKWLFNTKQQVIKSHALFVSAKKDVSAKRFDSAFRKLISALNKNRGDADVAFYLLQLLLKAWPSGWSKQQVKHLAHLCVSLLNRSEYAHHHDFHIVCNKVSKKVNSVLTLVDKAA